MNQSEVFIDGMREFYHHDDIQICSSTMWCLFARVRQ